MRQRRKEHLTLGLAMVVVCICAATGAASGVSVAWAGETFLDVTMVVVENAGHNWRKAGGYPTPSVKEIQRMTAEFAVRQVMAKGKKD